MKTGFFIMLFCIISAGLLAQYNIDSLKKALPNATDKEKIQILHQLGKAFKAAFNYEQALEYYQLELEINRKNADRDAIARNLNNIGIIYRRMENYERAIIYYDSSLVIKEELNDLDGIAVTANNIGIAYKSMGKYDQALKYYLKALDIKEKLDDKSSLSKTLNNIGVIFRELGDYDKALDYYQISYAIKQEINDKPGMAKLLNNMGIVYEHLTDYDKALEFFNKSIAIKEVLGDKDGIAHSLNNMGKIQSGFNNNEEALELYRRSLELKKETGDKSHIALAHNNIANIFIDIGKYDSASYHLEKAISNANKEEVDDILKKAYWFSAKLFAKQGDYKKAYENYRSYSLVKDRLIEMQNKKNAAQIEALYNFEKREREMKFQEEKRVQLVKTVAVSTSLAFLLISLFFYSRYRLKQKSNKALLEKTEQLQAQKHELTNNKKELLIAKEKAEESDRLKSAFLANMSHEIRTPMNGILGFADLLKQPELRGDKKDQYIDIIQKSGERMLNIINDLIEISKIESGQMKIRLSAVNLNKEIKDLYLFFRPEADKKGVELNYTTYLSWHDEIITDREKLNAVLINLIKNAVKYTDKGSISFGYHIRSSYIEFFVVDTGQGINSERLEAIFKRFVQADYNISREKEGAGLGLSIARAYVHMLGGSMQVSSDYGKGSRFTFFIPHKKVPIDVLGKTELTEHIQPDAKELQEVSILIAEDEKSSALYLNDILNKHCKKLVFAETGTQVLELFRQNPDTDIILMDVQMPELDGYAVTRKIRQMNSDVIIIAQTAHAFESDRKKALEAGCDDHIAKPIAKKQLLQKIILNLRKKNKQPENNHR